MSPRGRDAWLVLTGGTEVEWAFAPLAHVGAVAGTVLLALAAGLASSIWVLQRRPVGSGAARGGGVSG